MLERLERINRMIDLCIDQELYTHLDSIIRLSPSAQSKLRELFEDGQDLPEFVSFDVGELPIVEVCIGTKTIEFSKNPFLGIWSKLFWAKLLRGEIQKQNRRPWVRLFDDLVEYLERLQPHLSSRNEIDQWNRTRLNYLLELSAVALGESSYGYADRARTLLKDIFSKSDIQDRLKYGSFYDRWIWFNKGLAYQHLNLHQKAALEFNQTISKFWKYVSDKEKTFRDEDTALAGC